MTTKYGFRTPHHKPGRKGPGFSVSARRIEAFNLPLPVSKQHTRLNGSRFGSVEAAKAFALKNLPVWYQQYESDPVSRFDTKYDVERYFSGDVNADELVMRKISAGGPVTREGSRSAMAWI